MQMLKFMVLSMSSVSLMYIYLSLEVSAIPCMHKTTGISLLRFSTALCELRIYCYGQ